MSEEQVKKGPGRPPKAILAAKPSEDEAVPMKSKMKAKPNWEEFDDVEDTTPDRLRINPDLIPDGMVLQWVTDSVFGQSMAQHRSIFERVGWTPVHQEDFDGRFNGMFMPRNAQGEINVEGLVLMARPKEYNIKSKRKEMIKAREQIEIKERALRGGDMPNVSLDTRDKSALQTNKINRSYERIAVPED